MAFETHKVVPDILDVAPEKMLDVSYDSNKVDGGNVLTPTQVKSPPKITWQSNSNDFYALCMTDLDAPNRQQPKFREWHHWLVVNIPGSDVSKGQVLSEYVGACPPKESGLHRYAFLLYKQKGKISPKEKKLTNRSGDGRGKFSTKQFARSYEMGNPVAGNFFQAEWDSYVPTLHKQLSGK